MMATNIVAKTVKLACVSILIGGASLASGNENDIHLICGAENVEDMVALPGTDWIVGSGIGDSFFQRGALHLINERRMTAETVRLDFSPRLRPIARYNRCPAPPGANEFSAHGMGLRPRSNGTYDLFVMNHGGRESVEVFRIVLSKGKPNFRWIGCIATPPNAMGNSVAVTRDGTVVLSAFTAADHPLPSMVSLSKAAPSDRPERPGEFKFKASQGALFTWNRRDGWTKLANSELNGNNGLELSADDKWVFVNSWSDRRIVRVALKNGAGDNRSVHVDFMPDNLRWSFDGKLVATGQDVADPREVFACTKSSGSHCPTAYAVAEVDPGSLSAKTIYRANAMESFGTATIGLRTRRGLWLGSVRSQCIGYVNAESLGRANSTGRARSPIDRQVQ